MSNLGLGLGLGKSSGGITPFVPSHQLFNTQTGADFNSDNGAETFKVVVPPPAGVPFTLGDHEAGQSIQQQVNIKSGTPMGKDLISLEFNTQNSGFLFSATGDLLTCHKRSADNFIGMIAWGLSSPWNIDLGYSGPTEELVISTAAFGAGYSHDKMNWDDNGNIVHLFVDYNSQPYNWLGFDLTTPYQITGEGTKVAADRSNNTVSGNNEGRGFSFGTNSFFLCNGNSLQNIQKWDLNAGGFPDTLQQSVIPVPDQPPGMGNTRGGVFVFDSGNGLMVVGDNGNVGGIYYGIRRYSMSTPYDLTTMVMEEWIDFQASGTGYTNGQGDPETFIWKPDGTKYWWGGSNNSGGQQISQVLV